jgi:pimeloyl-ACP methyl ester carboxylesterase
MYVMVAARNRTIAPIIQDLGRDGDPVSLRQLRRMPEVIAEIADGYLLVYRMPATRGGQTIATAMLFVPRALSPPKGFPLVAYCHGTTGWAAQWAPSVCVENASHPKYKSHWEHGAPVAAILAAGHVVVAPDYEGLGDTTLGVPEASNTYYCSRGEGRSVYFAVVASKRVLGDSVSGAWAAVGHSQGGKAVIAAAEQLAALPAPEPALDFRGGIPIATSTNTIAKMNERWAVIEAASAAHDPDGSLFYLGVLNAYSILYVWALNCAGYRIDPESMFRDRALRFFKERSHIDHWSLIGEMIEDATLYVYCDVVGNRVFNPPVSYPGVRIEAINSPPFRDAMEENEVGRIRVPGEFLIIQGTADVFTPERWCRELVNTMLTNGTSVRYSVHTGADHYGVLQAPAAQKIMQEHLRRLFSDHE